MTERNGDKMDIFELRDVQKTICEKLGDNIDQQLIEEMAELTQVLCQKRRVDGQGQPTDKSEVEIHAAIYEEIVDVIICLKEYIYYHDLSVAMLALIEKQKIARTLSRLGVK